MNSSPWPVTRKRDTEQPFSTAQALHGVDMRTAKQKREAGDQPPAEELERTMVPRR